MRIESCKLFETKRFWNLMFILSSIIMVPVLVYAITFQAMLPQFENEISDKVEDLTGCRDEDLCSGDTKFYCANGTVNNRPLAQQLEKEFCGADYTNKTALWPLSVAVPVALIYFYIAMFLFAKVYKKISSHEPDQQPLLNTDQKNTGSINFFQKLKSCFRCCSSEEQVDTPYNQL